MPTDPVEPLRAAFGAARDSLASIDRAQLSDPTPCTSWDVRALVNHMVGAPRAAVRLLGQGDLPDDLDFASGDYLSAHDETAMRTSDAFAGPGVLEQMVEFPFGQQPAAFLMFFVGADQLAHAWDLARAGGRSTDIAPDLSVAVLAEAQRIVSPDMRGPDGEAAFGPEQVVGPRASAADRLAAFLGRRV